MANIGPKSRKERPRKTKIGTEVAYVTCDSDTTFKGKGQSHQAALLTAVLARQTAAVVAVRNCCYVAVCSAARGASAPRGGERQGHIVAAARPPIYSLLFISFLNVNDCDR